MSEEKDSSSDSNSSTPVRSYNITNPFVAFVKAMGGTIKLVSRSKK